MKIATSLPPGNPQTSSPGPGPFADISTGSVDASLFEPRSNVIRSGGRHRQRQFTSTEKLRFVQEALQPGATVASVARRHGIRASALLSWKKRLAALDSERVDVDETVALAARLEKLEARLQDLEHQLSSKITEVEALRAMLAEARAIQF